ncbi:MAG: HAD-IIA family hydrolase [Methanopyri archaeon]|nr:HAD-IIA family hydrolase [Methanopyri archaeon]
MAPISGLIVDIDGVVYRGNTPLPGAIDAINMLSERLKVLFLTNNSTRSRAQYCERLSSMGIEMERCSVLNSSRATALHLSSSGIQSALVIGESGLVDELVLEGIQIVDREAEAVVVGLDRSFSYEKMAAGLREILGGATFVATNPDPTIPEEGGLLPGNGAQVAALQRASGVEPLVVGKPERIIMDIALDELGTSPEHILTIGDRLDTDILAGIRAGTRTCLVLTGATGRDALEATDICPDHVLESIADLQALLESLEGQ